MNVIKIFELSFSLSLYIYINKKLFREEFFEKKD